MVLGDDTWEWDAQQVIRNIYMAAYLLLLMTITTSLTPRRRIDASGLPLVRWKGPKLGQLKLNMDGCFSTSSNIMCIA